MGGELFLPFLRFRAPRGGVPAGLPQNVARNPLFSPPWPRESGSGAEPRGGPLFGLRPGGTRAKMNPMTAPVDRTGTLFSWLSSRSAGVLLHPTSLPGGQGVGTLDGAAIRFLDFLQASGMSWWQVCP